MNIGPLTVATGSTAPPVPTSAAGASRTKGADAASARGVASPHPGTVLDRLFGAGAPGAQRRAEEFGLGFPKGVLLLGVPGCGKSLCAKSVAHEWGLPLLKLDPSNLYDKYVGESEHNFKRAMLTAERLAPIVLWIDELEKAFASASADADAASGRH